MGKMFTDDEIETIIYALILCEENSIPDKEWEPTAKRINSIKFKLANIKKDQADDVLRDAPPA